MPDRTSKTLKHLRNAATPHNTPPPAQTHAEITMTGNGPSPHLRNLCGDDPPLAEMTSARPPPSPQPNTQLTATSAEMRRSGDVSALPTSSIPAPISGPPITRKDTHTPMATAAPRFLTPEELAEMFNVPKESVYQWRRKRTGPPGFRVGRHLRYDLTAVLAWVQQQTHESGVN